MDWWKVCSSLAVYKWRDSGGLRREVTESSYPGAEGEVGHQISVLL